MSGLFHCLFFVGGSFLGLLSLLSQLTLEGLLSDSLTSSLHISSMDRSSRVNLLLTFFLHDSVLNGLHAVSLATYQLKMLLMLVKLSVEFELVDLGSLISTF